MSSPWEPGISQAMQQHGGSNRSIPKTKPSMNGQPDETQAPAMQAQPAKDFDPSMKSERSDSVAAS